MLKISKRYKIPFYSSIISPFGMIGIFIGLANNWNYVTALGSGLMALVSFGMMIWVYRGGLSDSEQHKEIKG